MIVLKLTLHVPAYSLGYQVTLLETEKNKIFKRHSHEVERVPFFHTTMSYFYATNVTLSDI